mmetsp:Transcript_30184/g.97400  ORF Transcript_30184/g.97400 Transcript_30184/m.97400 type:complete len:250 (+) Transcript_30184:56-805(+)
MKDRSAVMLGGFGSCKQVLGWRGRRSKRVTRTKTRVRRTSDGNGRAVEHSPFCLPAQSNFPETRRLSRCIAPSRRICRPRRRPGHDEAVLHLPTWWHHPRPHHLLRTPHGQCAARPDARLQTARHHDAACHTLPHHSTAAAHGHHASRIPHTGLQHAPLRPQQLPSRPNHDRPLQHDHAPWPRHSHACRRHAHRLRRPHRPLRVHHAASHCGHHLTSRHCAHAWPTVHPTRPVQMHPHSWSACRIERLR